MVSHGLRGAGPHVGEPTEGAALCGHVVEADGELDALAIVGGLGADGGLDVAVERALCEEGGVWKGGLVDDVGRVPRDARGILGGLGGDEGRREGGGDDGSGAHVGDGMRRGTDGECRVSGERVVDERAGGIAGREKEKGGGGCK